MSDRTAPGGNAMEHHWTSCSVDIGMGATVPGRWPGYWRRQEPMSPTSPWWEGFHLPYGNISNGPWAKAST